ncbi:MAG: DUF309 domain-containing protein [Actinomycetota bacterium]|nr:DUF309 domain-containing protein [Actinomycetota bacterium]
MNAPRDRDVDGRARNARPRDALGRPLPHGTPAAPAVEELRTPTPEQTLDRAQELLDAGRPFHAHEALEAMWKCAPPNERDLWQGLAQLAVGATHAARGNEKGAAALLRRGIERLTGYQRFAPYEVDVAALQRWAADAISVLAASPNSPGLPVLQLRSAPTRRSDRGQPAT